MLIMSILGGFRFGVFLPLRGAFPATGYVSGKIRYNVALSLDIHVCFYPMLVIASKKLSMTTAMTQPDTLFLSSLLETRKTFFARGYIRLA